MTSTSSRALLRAAALGRPFAGRLAGSVALSVLAVGFGVALLTTSGYLISRAAERPEVMALAVAIAGVRFFALARAVTRYLERLASHSVALHVLVEARVSYLARLIPLAPARLPRGGDALSGVVADVDRLQHLFVRALAPPVVAAAVIVGVGVAAWLMLPVAGAVLIAALVVAAVGVPLLSVTVTRHANRRQGGARAAVAVEITETISGAQELVALGQGAAQVERVAAADTALRGLVLQDALGTALAVAAGIAASGLAAVALLVIAVPAVGDGSLAGVLLAALVLMAMASFEAVNGLPAAAQGMATTGEAVCRLELTAPSDPAWVVGGSEPSPTGPVRLDVRGVAVRPSPAAHAVVRDVSFTLEPGERVALVGPSGCGKSTLLWALVGLAPVAEGSISVDGVDISRLDPVALRDRIRLLDQEAYLFATTVAENVRLGRPGATDDDVRAALDRVGLGPWIESLPNGLRTYLGDDGARCSGGQRQRIALARGLLSGADLLLADEPTSHLDESAAEAFLDDLLAAPRSLGVLVTTHRMSGIDRFDRILVMREGTIVEQGSHAVLRREGTVYPRLLAASTR